MRPLIIAAIIVTTLVVIAFAGKKLDRRREARRLDDYAAGVWSGDPSFLRKSGLSEFTLYIGPEDSTTRQGYCLMVGEHGNEIINSPLTAEFTIGQAKNQTATADIELHFDSGPTPIPEKLKMSLSMADGTLALYDDEKIVAFFYKDHAATHVARKTEEAPI